MFLIHEGHKEHEERKQIKKDSRVGRRENQWYWIAYHLFFVLFVSFVDDCGSCYMTELLLKEEVYAIIGAAIEVHRELGSGFLEPVYQEAMEIELTERVIPFHAQRPLNIRYKERILAKQYVPDLVCYDQIIVELKALNCLSGTEESQVLNYLKASGLRVGVLVNFGSHGKLEWRRFVR
jgi:GxxExxY protein